MTPTVAALIIITIVTTATTLWLTRLTRWALKEARQGWQAATDAHQELADLWDAIAQAFGIAADQTPTDGWLWLAAALQRQNEKRRQEG